MTTQVKTKKKISVAKMTKIAMLSVLAFVFMQLELIIPIFPQFLKLDISDLPALVGAFAMGPLAGVVIELVKNMLHLFQTSTFGVGELANFFIGSAIIVPSAIIYKKHKSRKSAITGLAIGTVAMAIMGAIMNYFVLIPFYAAVLKFPVEAIVGMGTAVNGNITSLFTLILLGIVPFNLLKGVVLSIITLVIYKHISPILHKGL